jgi:hypothetical protein
MHVLLEETAAPGELRCPRELPTITWMNSRIDEVFIYVMYPSASIPVGVMMSFLAVGPLKES